jgi:amino acid transporter
MTAATNIEQGPAGGENRHLRRDIGRIGLLFAGVGSIIGSGWLFGAMNASIIAGPSAVFSWIIAGVMIILIGLSFSELGTMFPVTGGVIRFPQYAFGGFASFSMGWITWVAAAVVPAIETTGRRASPSPIWDSGRPSSSPERVTTPAATCRSQ